MKKIFQNLFLQRRDNSNLYRVMLSNIQTEEVDNGILGFICNFIIINHQTQEISKLKYSFVGDVFDFRATQFFDFLKKSKVKFVDYFELIGIVFDAELHVDDQNTKRLIYKKMLARPIRVCG